MLKPAIYGGALVAAALAGSAAAQAPQSLGKFGEWTAYAYTEGGRKVCYLLAQPKDSLPKGARRGDIYLMVTHRPAAKVRDEVSVHLGYPLKPNSSVEAAVGAAKFSLFTRDETAWAADAKTDKALAEAMQKGSLLTVRGTSARGTETTDSYGLSGFTAARGKIGEACPG